MNRPPPLPLEEAQARLLALAEPMPVERVDAASALGRYLTEPLHARRTQPAANVSAMDGYAVRAADIAGPWQVIGESAAGHPFSGNIGAGQAVRISTGAIVPAGTNAVVLQEDIAREENSIRLSGDAPSPIGKHIRRAGMDFTTGSEVLGTGMLVGPAQVALAIASGHNHLSVRRVPRITVIDSGDELARDCEHCPPHQIPASNGAMLAALASYVPCLIDQPGPVADDMAALAAVLDAAHEADVIVTSGGASVGDHDLIRPALAEWGADIDFWRIAIKPGKPLLVATRQRRHGRQIILGLPGNPVSSHVTAFLFLLPLLRALLGAARPLPLRVATRLGAPLRAGGSRREFIRACWDGMQATPHAVQDSGALFALSASNLLIDRPAGAPEKQAGDAIEGYLIVNGGIA